MTEVKEMHDTRTANVPAGVSIVVADSSHEKYVDEILETIRVAARRRGTGIAERTHDYLSTKMKES